MDIAALKREVKKTGNLNICPVCNSRCIFCYEQPKRPLYPFPTFDEVKKIIDDFKENQVDHIMFLGGEPLLRKDVFDIVRYGTEMGIRFGMTTNGQLLGNRQTIMKLLESGLCDFEISIHSADEEGFHLLNRSKKGNWHSVITALDLLNEILPRYEGRQVIINTVVMDKNRDFLSKIPELLDKHLSNLKPPWMLKNIQAFPCTETSRSDSAPRRLTVKETAEFLPGIVKPWMDRFDIMLQSFPLCAIPGVEHLSQSLKKKISNRIHIGNVRFGINRIVPDPVPCEPLLSPHRSICKGCSLWMICWETDIFVDSDELGDYYDLPIKSDRNPVEILMNSGLSAADAEALVRNFTSKGIWEEAETLEREFEKIFQIRRGEGGCEVPGASMAIEFINANEMILTNGRERGKIVFLPFEFASQPIAVVSDIGIEAKHPTSHELVSNTAAKIGIAVAQAPNLKSWRAAVWDVWASTRPKDFKSTEIPEVIGFERFRKLDLRNPDTIEEIEALFLNLLSPEITGGSLIPDTRAYFLGVCGTDLHFAANGCGSWIRTIPEELSKWRLTSLAGIAFEMVGEKEAGSEISAALERVKQVISAKEGIKTWMAMVRKFWNSNMNASKFLLGAAQ